jgi:hypothetical protein
MLEEFEDVAVTILGQSSEEEETATLHFCFTIPEVQITRSQEQENGVMF